MNSCVLHQPVVRGRKLEDDLPKFGEPKIVRRFCRIDELVVQVEGAHGVGQFTEIHLQKGGDRMDILDR